MGVEIISNPLSVSALLSGEIDHHTAAAMRADMRMPSWLLRCLRYQLQNQGSE